MPIQPHWPLVDDPAWTLLPAHPDLDRRMGILTLTLGHPEPGSPYDVRIPEAGRALPFRWRSLPDRIDRPGLDAVTLLFGSCFWRNNDREGAYEAAVLELTKLGQPAFKLLIGDQVYQDWPWDLLGDDIPMRRYADRYDQYWGDPGYRNVLTSSPNFFLADDHEFWNDFPERQIQLRRTWTAEGRRQYGEAADRLYWYYQRSANPGPELPVLESERWYSFEIDPVSFFVADTRSLRTPVHQDDAHFIPDEEWSALEQWAGELRGPGVLVLGQPMFAGKGGMKDHTLPDFERDYGRLCRLIEDVARGVDSRTGDRRSPHDILMLSGDIHTGRYCSASVPGDVTSNEVHELVSSASSQIGTLWKPSHKPPPTKLSARYGQRSFNWSVRMTSAADFPTIDNNVGVVRMSQGTNGRIRFELSIWRIRPYDERSWLSRLLRGRVPQGPLIRLFHRELQLR